MFKANMWPEMSKLIFTSWDGRPAIVDTLGLSALAIVEPGGDWVPVDAGDVFTSARVIPGDETDFKAVFEERFGSFNIPEKLPQPVREPSSQNYTRENKQNYFSKLMQLETVVSRYCVFATATYFFIAMFYINLFWEYRNRFSWEYFFYSIFDGFNLNRYEFEVLLIISLPTLIFLSGCFWAHYIVNWLRGKKARNKEILAKSRNDEQVLTYDYEKADEEMMEYLETPKGKEGFNRLRQMLKKSLSEG